MRRSRTVYVGLTVGVVLVGLASRELRDAWPGLTTAYIGDTLWAVMFFVGFAAARPAASTLGLAAAVLGVTLAIELSQLYHAPWIDGVRAVRLGRLLLGNTFLWSDVACLAAGTGLAVGLDRVLLRRPWAARTAQ